MINSIDVIRPLVEYIEYNSIDNVQIIGGVNSVALEHEKTIIDVVNKEIIAPKDLFLSTKRPDGTLRDLDILVLSSDSNAIDCVKNYVDLTISDNLEQSVFGYRPERVLQAQITHSMGAAALKTFLSDRYETSDGMLKSLFPFSVPIDPESLETWMLSVGDFHVPIPNPAMSIINYTNRSIGGIRPKDRLKVDKLAHNIFSKAPELRDWAIDGPGSSQVRLGTVLKSLTPNKDHSDYFGDSVNVKTLDQLSEERDIFLLPELDKDSKLRMLGVAVIKANVLSSLESNQAIVTFFQRFAERHFTSIVNNE